MLPSVDTTEDIRGGTSSASHSKGVCQAAGGNRGRGTEAVTYGDCNTMNDKTNSISRGAGACYLEVQEVQTKLCKERIFHDKL